jgi:hypothetical protein
MQASEIEGPSERLVSLSRISLTVVGWILLALGGGVAIAGGLGAVAALLITFAIAHFLAARFASRRLAVFLAWVGV